MPPWMLKAAVQGVTSLLPNAERWSQLLQRYVTGSLKLDEATAKTKADRCTKHLANHAEAAGAARAVSELAVMELGTGWFPVAPVALSLAGARQVFTVDNTSHLTPEHVRRTLEVFAGLVDRGALAAPRADRMARLRGLCAEPRPAPVSEVMRALDVTALVTDARRMRLDAGTVDLFLSNNTLEHIPGPIIEGIFREFYRVGRADAVMSHWIDMGDHYANFDRSIGVYNFLKYPRPVWRLFNNDLQYQNRLRVPDFRDLHAAAGWRIVREDNVAGAPDDLRRIRVAREFRRYREEDLLVYETWMVARR